MLRKTIASSLVLSLTWTAWAMAAPQSGQASSRDGLTYDQAMKRLDRFIHLVEELRTQIDRSQFDLEALLDDLNYDPGAVIRFVTKRIYFEQYPGLLRGAVGTLMSRAGNALDQALLLATLLRDCGFDARIVRGALDENEARALLHQMDVKRAPRPPFADEQAFLETLGAMADSIGWSRQELTRKVESYMNRPAVESSKLYENVVSDADFLLAELEDADVTLGDSRAEDSLIDEATDYFWVEFRTEVSEPWMDVHPAFLDPPDFLANLQATEVFTEAIPDRLQQRFRFQVFLTDPTESGAREIPLMAPWERPAANLVGVPLSFANVPEGILSMSDPRDAERAVRESEIFLPMFNDGPAGGKVFDLAGNVFPLDAAMSPFAGVFRSVSGSVSRAASALGDLGGSATSEGEAQPPERVQEVLEYTLISANGAETTRMRQLLDPRLRQPERSLSESMARRLTMMLATGSYPVGYSLDRILERIVESQPLLAVLLMKQAAPDEKVVVPESELKAVDTRWLGHLALFEFFDRDLAAIAERQYRPEPSLVVYEEPLLPQSQSGTAIDVVFNSRRSTNAFSSPERSYPRNLVLRGVWETEAESAVLEEGGDLFSTGEVFRLAREQDIPIRVLYGSNAAGGSLELPEAAEEELSADLAAGYAIVVPERVPQGTQGRAAWWRIDPRSGETLGVGDDGRGVAAVTWITITAAVLLGIIAASVCMVYTEGAGGHERTKSKMGTCLGIGGAVATYFFSPLAALAVAIALALFDIHVLV